ncbi:MAG: PAS domain S-box protein [Patescibacteria group bacterium]
MPDKIKKNVSNINIFQKTKERYKEIWNNSPVGYHIVDKKGVIREVNKTEAKMLGYQPKEMVGKPIFNFIIPSERTEAKKRIHLKVTGHKVPRVDNRIYLKKNGERIYVSVDDVVEKDKKGKIIGIIACIVDLTEEKKAQIELDRIFNISIDMISIAGLDGYFKSLNPAFKKVLGYNNDELLKKPFINFVHPADQQNTILQMKKLKTGKKVINFLNRYRTKNGDYRWFSWNAIPLKEQNAIYSVTRDVTERIIMEETLKQSEERYRKLVDNAEDGVIIINREGNIILANKAAFRISGYNKNELINMHFSKFVHPEDYHLINYRFKGRIAGKKVKSNLDFRIINKKGEIRYMNYSGSSIIKDKKIIGLQGIVRDRTEKKLIEDEIRRLNEFNQRILDNAPVSIIVLNKEGNIISINNLAVKLLNKTKKKILGKKLITSKLINNCSILAKKYKLLLAKGEPFYLENAPYLPAKAKQKKYFNIIAVPLLNKEKKVEGAISMALDNTEATLAKKSLEDLNRVLEEKVIKRTEELNIINKKLNKALNLKSRFISDASHELRTPLTILQGNLDLAVKECRGKKIRLPKSIKYINKEIEQMTQILTDLTILTNADAKNEPINYEAVNINNLIKAVCQSLNILAREKKVKFIHENSDENIIILGDENKIEKMLLNIIRNAIKYNRDKGWIKIRVEKTKNEIQINIKDSGVGIPKKYHNLIFERFFRVDKARTREGGGTGLGLSISQSIAELHGGKIGLDSKFGEGSTFTIHLPNKKTAN